MNDEVLRFIWIIALVAVLMLLGEVLHRIFRAPKTPPRKTVAPPVLYQSETFEERFSIRHLEKFFLMIFASFLAFLLLLVRGTEFQIPIFIIGGVGFWWAFRRGILR